MLVSSTRATMGKHKHHNKHKKHHHGNEKKHVTGLPPPPSDLNHFEITPALILPTGKTTFHPDHHHYEDEADEAMSSSSGSGSSSSSSGSESSESSSSTSSSTSMSSDTSESSDNQTSSSEDSSEVKHKKKHHSKGTMSQQEPMDDMQTSSSHHKKKKKHHGGSGDGQSGSNWGKSHDGGGGHHHHRTPYGENIMYSNNMHSSGNVGSGCHKEKTSGNALNSGDGKKKRKRDKKSEKNAKKQRTSEPDAGMGQNVGSFAGKPKQHFDMSSIPWETTEFQAKFVADDLKHLDEEASQSPNGKLSLHLGNKSVTVLNTSSQQMKKRLKETQTGSEAYNSDRDVDYNRDDDDDDADQLQQNMSSLNLADKKKQQAKSARSKAGNGNDNGSGLEDSDNDGAPSSSAKNGKTAQPDDNAEHDIVHRFIVTGGNNPFPRDLEYNFGNINIPGHYTPHHSDTGLTYVMSAGETVNAPKVIATSKIDGKTLQYHQRFPRYGSIEDMKKTVFPDVNKKVKIIHTAENPHPLVEYYTARHHEKVIAQQQQQQPQPQQQQQKNTKSSSSKKKGGGGSSSSSATNETATATQPKFSMMAFPGLKHSQDDTDMVIMDKKIYEKTLKKMKKDEDITGRIAALSDVSKPFISVVPSEVARGDFSAIVQARKQKTPDATSATTTATKKNGGNSLLNFQSGSSSKKGSDHTSKNTTNNNRVNTTVAEASPPKNVWSSSLLGKSGTHSSNSAYPQAYITFIVESIPSGKLKQIANNTANFTN